MIEPQPSTRISNVANLDARSTSMFLRLGLDGPRKPIDSLLERLRQAQGTGLFADLLRAGPAAELLATDGGDRPAKTVELELLRRIKNDSVQLFRSYRDLNSHLAATATFFSAIATALALHGEKITSQPAEEIEGAFLDLAAVLAHPWDELFIAAAKRLGARPK